MTLKFRSATVMCVKSHYCGARPTDPHFLSSADDCKYRGCETTRHGPACALPALSSYPAVPAARRCLASSRFEEPFAWTLRVHATGSRRPGTPSGSCARVRCGVQPKSLLRNGFSTEKGVRQRNPITPSKAAQVARLSKRPMWRLHGLPTLPCLVRSCRRGPAYARAWLT